MLELHKMLSIVLLMVLMSAFLSDGASLLSMYTTNKLYLLLSMKFNLEKYCIKKLIIQVTGIMNIWHI